ncbi:MAG TPA: hypothetical protein VM345_02915 [Acidimicrobiales bacterium]|jgi:two-component system, NtrC family, sensor kinase|nr:hypothetical protein [Acidimicrobiales bacterium]
MSRLDTFSVDDLVALSADVREAGGDARTMEEAGAAVVEVLHRCLTDSTGGPACALVRLYKTHQFEKLPADLQQFAAAAGGGDVRPDTRCLTLVATTGTEPAWRDRRSSAGHQAIPLTSESAVAALPMVARLISELGLDVAHVVRPPQSDLALQLHHQSFNVFHVPDAVGSQWIPAQDFVERYGIRSALGFGGMLPTGDMFAVIMFTTVPVDERVADLFRSVAPAAKAAIVRHSFRVFAS